MRLQVKMGLLRQPHLFNKKVNGININGPHDTIQLGKSLNIPTIKNPTLIIIPIFHFR